MPPLSNENQPASMPTPTPPPVSPMPPTSPVFTTPVSLTEKIAPPKKINPHIFVGALGGIVVIFIAVLFVTGILSLPKFSNAPYETSDVLAGVVKGLSLITSTKTELTVALDGTRITKDTVVLSDGSMESNWLKQGPFTASLTINAVGAFQNIPQMMGTVSGDITVSGVPVSLAAEYRKIATSTYIKITDVSHSFDIDKIKGLWVSMPSGDLANYTGVIGNLFLGANGTMITRLQSMLSLLNLNGAVKTVAGPVTEKINGETVYRYDLVFEPSGLLKVLASTNAEADRAFYTSLTETLRLSIWATKAGVPLRFALKTNASAASPVLAIDAVLTFSDLNKPVTVEMPQGAISIEEAARQTFGKQK